MNKNLKLLLGASTVAMLSICALQGCSSDATPSSGTPSAGAPSAGAPAAGAPAAGAPAAGAPAAGAPAAGAPAGGDSSGGSGGSSAGAGGTSAGTGGTAAGAGGTSGGAGGASGGAGGAAATTFTLQTAGTVGQVLATAAGFTLYVYKPDTPSTTAPVSTCTGGCLTNWPIYYGNPVSVPAALMASDFASFSNAGTMQSTYKGWPLYTYVMDTAVGQAKGDMAGGNWFAVKIPFTAPK